MVLSRRDFVRLGSLCAISAGLSLGFINQVFGQERRGKPESTNTGFAIPIEAQRDPLFFMNRQTFSQYLETKFIIDPGYTYSIETTLIEVKDLRSPAAQKKNASGQECFLLTFRNESEKTVKQGTYQVKHDALGTFELFVVPSQDREGGKFFEAVINRVVE